MSEFMALVLALMSGALLGVLFFGGLWWTIRLGVCSTTPALWFLGSLLLRTSGVVGGMYLISHQDWRQLVACLLGFLLARVCVIRSNHTLAMATKRPLSGAQP
jgi:F1F0 ATPase subunit 2